MAQGETPVLPLDSPGDGRSGGVGVEGALGVGGGADCTFSNKRHTVDVFPLLSVSDLSEIVLFSFVEEFVAFFYSLLRFTVPDSTGTLLL